MWMLGFGINWPMLIGSFVCLAVLMVYTVYDVLSVVEDLNFYKDRCAELKENYRNVCEANKHLKDYIKEDAQEIARLRKLLGYY